MRIKPLRSQARRGMLKLPLALMGMSLLSHPLRVLATNKADLITVWKTPNCGCCKEWVVHLRKEGFHVVTNDVNDTAPIRQKLGLPAKFGSCHTAQVSGYVLEGHVPAREVMRLLRDKPAAVGLAVPGMPVGSPGMEMPGDMLGVRDAFDVVLVNKDGNASVYASYPAQAATASRARS